MRQLVLVGERQPAERDIGEHVAETLQILLKGAAMIPPARDLIPMRDEAGLSSIA
jgi:hypothetical protein